jgi:hypothetical protein
MAFPDYATSGPMSLVTGGSDAANNVPHLKSSHDMPSPRFTFDRLLVLAASSAGIIAAIVVLSFSWPAPTGMLIARISDTANITMCLLVLGMALLIAWRAGGHAPNMAIALSMTFIYGSTTVNLLFDRLQVVQPTRQLVQLLLFLLASAFYIRATQRFPRKLNAADVSSSPTIWGKAPPLRLAASTLLHPAGAWAIAATATAVIAVSPGAHVFTPMWMAVTATGIVYFYITLRGPDIEARHKVLWFFEAALAAAIITMFAGALDLALGDSMTPNARAVMQLIFNVATGLAIVICFATAVFYAGAMSSALIVRKTLVFGATVGLLLFVSAVVEIYVAHSLIHALHVSDRFASAVLGAIFGLAFHPLKHRIELFMKRFAPKDKATVEPAATVSALQAEVTGLTK